MNETLDNQVNRSGESALPETPHELPFDRGMIDALVDRIRAGERVNLGGKGRGTECSATAS